MIIEIDYCRSEGCERGGSTKSLLIYPGGRLKIALPELITVEVINNKNDNCGLVLGSKGVKASVYRDGNDEVGQEVNSGSISLTGKRIVLFSMPKNELRIYPATS